MGRIVATVLATTIVLAVSAGCSSAAAAGATWREWPLEISAGDSLQTWYALQGAVKRRWRGELAVGYCHDTTDQVVECWAHFNRRTPGQRVVTRWKPPFPLIRGCVSHFAGVIGGRLYSVDQPDCAWPAFPILEIDLRQRALAANDDGVPR